MKFWRRRLCFLSLSLSLSLSLHSNSLQSFGEGPPLPSSFCSPHPARKRKLNSLSLGEIPAENFLKAKKERGWKRRKDSEKQGRQQSSLGTGHMESPRDISEFLRSRCFMGRGERERRERGRERGERGERRERREWEREERVGERARFWMAAIHGVPPSICPPLIFSTCCPARQIGDDGKGLDKGMHFQHILQLNT